MKCGRKTCNAIAVAGLLGGAAAYGDIAQSGSVPVARALPNAPNGYAPDEVDCPSTRPSVRSAATLSPSEISWLENRRSKAADALIDFFGHVAVGSFDAAGYIRDHRDDVSNLPNIGIAVSGGGYRALMNGGGAIKAFDSRTEGSTAEGHLGGLLQSATYLSALSGGGWLVGSLYMNNYTTVSGLQYDEYGSVWEFQESITGPPPEEGRISFISRVIDSVEYWREVANDVDSKRDAGYPVSITDYWGRALSYQLINDTRGGVDYTWSSIALDNGFTEGDMPMPILVADGRNPGEQMISTNATVFEFNPFELGTFDPTVFGFIPTEFLGSAFRGGELPENASCVRGYDNAGFFMGTSSSLFNQFALNLEVANLPDFVEEPIAEILENIGDSNNDIAEYRPNPFFQYSPDSSPFANQQFLPLVDGGEDLQNIPLHPLIQPERHVDVIFAIDSSADNELRWPNGTSMDASYRRSLNVSGIANNTAFPAIPDVNTFVNLGLNNRPTFFGCDSANMTGPSPIIVYIPNAPYSTWSNVSTFQMTYEQSERDAIIENGYNVATMLNGTRDENWTACVGCAILSRSFERTGTTVPDICTQCFEDYCWDGSLNSTTPDTYGPSQLIMDEDHTSAASDRFAISIFAIFATATATLMASYNI